MVEVLNGDGERGQAGLVASALQQVGFHINGTGDAASFTNNTSVVEYPAGLASEAQTVAAYLKGPSRVAEDASIPSGVVYLVVGSSFDGVRSH